MTPAVQGKLAIEGGSPVRSRFLPYGHQSIDEEDIRAVVQVLRSDWLTTGPTVTEFEKCFADAVGARYAVAVSSGTAALHAAIHAAGVGPGDEVITPALSFVASANCVRYAGGTVEFADVLPEALTLDPLDCARRLTPATRAVVAVDYAGSPADLDDLIRLGQGKGVVVIEDAAHSLGAAYRGRPIGSVAPLTTFSLHPVKSITTGEGGMVATNDPSLAEAVRAFRNHGIDADHHRRTMEGSWWYDMRLLGFNYRLTDIQCALGRSQLRHLPRSLSRRREIAARYTEAFAATPELRLPQDRADRESAWHLYLVQLELDALRVGRRQIFQALRAENIGVNVHYIPIPWHSYYQRLGYRKGCWPVTEAAYERMLTLPIWAGMSDEDVSDAIAAVQKVIAAYRK